MPREGDEGVEPVLHRLLVEISKSPLLHHDAIAVTEPSPTAPVETTPSWVYPVPEEVQPARRLPDVGLLEVQTKGCVRESLDGSREIHQNAALVVPEYEVVHVAEVFLDAEFLFHESIQVSEVEIGKMLAGQSADRNAPEIVGLEGVDDSSEQGVEPGFLESPGQLFEQSILGDTLEIFPDIQFQEKISLAGKSDRLLERGKLSLAAPACLAVVDRKGLESRLAHVHDRMVQDPVSERRGGDDSPLRVVDDELTEPARL